jgi:tetratricopeptide (TPR) repeat protein
VQKKKQPELPKIDVAAKKKELQEAFVETAESKAAYKQFSKLIEELERSEATFPSIFSTAMTKLVQMDVPKKVHWRIFMDLADYAKRDSRFETAIHLYRIVVSMQPYAHQGWLEYAKMEEECGNQEGCRDILKKGIQFSPLNENLYLKLVRIEERRNDVASVRKMTK